MLNLTDSILFLRARWIIAYRTW